MAESATVEAPARSGRNRTWIMLVLVLGAAGVALLVLRGRDPSAVPLEPMPGPSTNPDFYMDGAAISQYRSDGSLEYELSAARIRHFATDARTELERPRLSLHDPEAPPWNASAEHGVLRRPPTGATEERLDLDGSVVLEQIPPGHGPVRLETPSLTLYPRRQYAETDQDVMIRGDMGRTTATGLQGDLQLGILSFSNPGGDRVQTVLQPEQFK